MACPPARDPESAAAPTVLRGDESLPGARVLDGASEGSRQNTASVRGRAGFMGKMQLF